MIWDLIVGGLWQPIALAFGALVVWLKVRSGAKIKAENRNMKEELEAHERLNEADLGHGATDADRVVRLREFADRHGKRD
jgi:hypothetical protein